MSVGAGHYEYHSAASALTIADARILRRVIIGTGADTETVTVADGESNTIAVLDAAAPIDIEFNVVVRSGLVVTPSDGALEVTVVYD